MNYKAIIWVLLLHLSVVNVTAQNKQFTYYLDENLSSVPKENASIIGRGYIENNDFRLDCFSNTTNKLLLVANFLDSSLQIFNGTYVLYYANSKVKEEGSYANDLKVGTWKKYDKSGKIVDSTIYENGVRVKFAKFYYYYNSKVEKNSLKTDSSKYSLGYEFTDSLRNEFTSQYYALRNEKKVLEKDVFFVGNNGIMKKYDSLQNVTIDTLFTREQSEAEYLDGPKGWVRLLQQNLNPNIPVDNGARAGLYTVIVKFIVNADGSISDIALENDPGYGMGKEALRVIKLAKKWKPAVEFGKIVKAYRRQPISFQIEEEKRRRLF